MTQIVHEGVIPDELSGSRLDQALAQLLPDYSRSRIKSWIDDGRVQLGGRKPRPRDIVNGGESWSLAASAMRSIARSVPEVPHARVDRLGRA